MGSSVLGIGLCSATDWGGGYSSCPLPLPPRVDPTWTQGRGFRSFPSSTHSGQSLVVGGQVAQQLLHREQQIRKGTHKAAASAQSPWVHQPGSPPSWAQGQELCLCGGWTERPTPASCPRLPSGLPPAPLPLGPPPCPLAPPPEVPILR